MQIILHQIVNCPFHGLIKDIYLQAKCLELMALKLEPDTAGERELMRSRPQFFCTSATFGGLPTRILYVFVGLAPLILFITGFVMWKHRYRTKEKNKISYRIY